MNLSKKQKTAFIIALVVLGIALSIGSFSIPIVQFQGVLLSLGVSILTTVIIDVYEKFLGNSESAFLEKLQSFGLFDVNYNNTFQAQEKMYVNAKKLRLLFSSGIGTLRTYEHSIVNLIVQNQCEVQIVLSSDEVIKNGAHLTPEGENTNSLTIIKNIISKVSELHGAGSIELRYSDIEPIGSLEIKDNDFCSVVPYLYKQFSNCSYHTIYKNTGKESDIYHRWEKHFTEIWENAKTKEVYTPNKNSIK